MVSNKDNFCATCATPWWNSGAPESYANTWHQTPWGDQNWTGAAQKPHSPRPHSPRARRLQQWQADAGTGKGKGGKGKDKPAGCQAPTVSQLPQAPKPGTFPAAPKPGVSSTSSSGSQSDALLLALLPHLSQDGLPPALQAQLGSFRSSNIALEGKQLHALVAQKSQAQKELSKLQLQRDKYEQSWTGYMAKLSELFSKQLLEHEDILAQFNAEEEQWAQHLEMTTQELRDKTSRDGLRPRPDDMEAEAMEQDEETAAAMEAAVQEKARMEARRAVQAEKNQELQKALHAAKVAAEATTKTRDSSRTPRRAGRQDVVNISDDDGGGTKVPP